MRNSFFLLFVAAGMLGSWVFLQPWIAMIVSAAVLAGFLVRFRTSVREPNGGPGLEDSAIKPVAGCEPEVVVLPIEDWIDLHNFAPRDIPEVVEEYLYQACKEGFSEVRIVHGKGTGFQKDRVRRVLASSPRVAGFRDAPPERGGWGATVVLLQKGSV